ncbi:TetR family transcriptional regulator [Pseudomonas amygdali pv. hibisci]|uniref:TetR family transcriptional regulator n=1 Tax=Pseudomonas amygdali pv. hibisci TaxID=251723 RepID=A0AB34TZN3_PSEA0|nr:TetR/AcrR family transcriptional regulator [Pseudomonas amygdali]KPX51074.1 TetR family transcriptional regulator [Pseudomonas amygdali pv. hibisci]RMN52930.1 TetR family transcriptional regulator [Pseudomonas amygdali pv. hibisci]
MRVKTDERRKAILEVAIDIFREVGYARASMAMISERLGGSKGTLYGYYSSKDELFAAAMMAVMEEQADEIMGLLDLSEPDVSLALRRFGEALLALLTSADTLAIMRAAIAEGANSKLGATLYEMGAGRAWDQIANYIARQQENGSIRPVDARVAAAHLKALLEIGFIEPLLFGAQPWFTPKEAVATAVDVFLRAYGSNPDGQ